MDFKDFFDDIFDDNNFEVVDNELIYNSLIEIFESKGFDKQLMSLTLACLDFVALKNIYDSEAEKGLGKTKAYYRMIRSMAIVNTILETFIVANDDIFEVVENFREEYINNELGKIGFEKSVDNRVAKYFKNNGGLE